MAKKAKVPVCDKIASQAAKMFSPATRYAMYQDIKKNKDVADLIGEIIGDDVDDITEEVLFHFFWRLQARLLGEIMTDKEIEQRIYK